MTTIDVTPTKSDDDVEAGSAPLAPYGRLRTNRSEIQHPSVPTFCCADNGIRTPENQKIPAYGEYDDEETENDDDSSEDDEESTDSSGKRIVSLDTVNVLKKLGDKIKNLEVDTLKYFCDIMMSEYGQNYTASVQQLEVDHVIHAESNDVTRKFTVRFLNAS